MHLLRHGEVHNPGGVLYGRLPGFRLSADGLAMARDAADALRGRDVTAVVASSLQRAQETAGPIAAVFDLPITTDDRLLESTNHFEGKTFGVGDGALKNPRHWPYLYNPFTPSWGEPYAVIATRMLAAAEAEAASRFGASRIEMTVIRQRPELIAWYERRGYALTGATADFPLDDERFGLPKRRDLQFVVLEKGLA